MKKVIFSGLILAFAGIGVISCEKEVVKHETQEAVIVDNTGFQTPKTRAKNGFFTTNDCTETKTTCGPVIIVTYASGIRQDLVNISNDATACAAYFTNNPTVLSGALSASQIQDLANGDAILIHRATTNNVDYHAFKLNTSSQDQLVIPVRN